MDGRGSEPAVVHRERAGLDVKVEDISEQVAALALQGPTSARLLRRSARRRSTRSNTSAPPPASIAGVPVDISRTGYTGDLGYEVWMPWDAAIRVWDAIADGGPAFDLHPAGMLALDVARIEAGLLLIDVDFYSSRKAMIEAQKYSPSSSVSGVSSISTRGRSSDARRCGRAPPRSRRADRRPGSGLDRGGTALRSRRPAPDCAGDGLARRGAGLQGRTPGRTRDVDDVVHDAQEVDRAGDGRHAPPRDRHAAWSSKSPSKPSGTGVGDRRQDAVFQSRKKNGAPPLRPDRRCREKIERRLRGAHR